MCEINVTQLRVIAQTHPPHHNTFKMAHHVISQEKCAQFLIQCHVKTGIAHQAVIAMGAKGSLDILFIKKRVKLTARAIIKQMTTGVHTAFRAALTLAFRPGTIFPGWLCHAAGRQVNSTASGGN